MNAKQSQSPESVVKEIRQQTRREGIVCNLHHLAARFFSACLSKPPVLEKFEDLQRRDAIFLTAATHCDFC